ncbi:MAG: heme ABC exporter ATP-binding protein CcmA [Proteobacteria bacterium]|nr:heme ABC exporter ATP-binding protein CcmA [Pseudomonadota bacterium]
MSSNIENVCVASVTKVFGAVRALASASMDVTSGEVVAVMGPNGAGKSTLLSILSLAMRPTRGEVLFNGAPVKWSDTELSGKIGLLSHQPLVYPDLTGRENLMLFARLYGVEDVRQAVAMAETELGLNGFGSDRPTRVLSRGQLQRVALARAIVSEPDLLLLDEPAAGLDSAAVSRISGVLDRLLARGGMAVIVTHEPDVAAEVATRAVMVKKGAIVTDREAPESAAGWRKLYTETVEGSGR